MGIVELLCAASMALNIGGSDARTKFACEQMETIVKEAEANDLPPELIVSLIHYESRFSPRVVSKAGACGLMQVIPRYTGNRKGGVNRGTGVPKLTCKQLKDPKTNIKYGTMTLKYWISKYGKGSVKIGLCGYNAGFRCKGEYLRDASILDLARLKESLRNPEPGPLRHKALRLKDLRPYPVRP